MLALSASYSDAIYSPTLSKTTTPEPALYGGNSINAGQRLQHTHTEEIWCDGSTLGARELEHVRYVEFVTAALHSGTDVVLMWLAL